MAQQTHKTDPVVFREEQRFTQTWVWLLVLGAVLATALPVAYGVVVQLVSGRPWGTRPMPDGALLGVALATFMFDGALVWLMVRLRLIVEVYAEHGVRVRFVPFVDRVLPYAAMARVYPRSYPPIREYGGWGIRGLRDTHRAYNVRGDRGVQIETTEGGRILLGSQQADRLAEAIEGQRRLHSTSHGSESGG